MPGSKRKFKSESKPNDLLMKHYNVKYDITKLSASLVIKNEAEIHQIFQ